MLSGLGCAAINNTDIINTAFDAHDKILQIFWTGAKHAVTGKLDVIVAYYHYNQNNFAAGPPCNGAEKATCSGTFHAVSFAVDWRFAAKFQAYAGLMFSQVNSGLANGYTNRNTIDPAVGLVFRFQVKRSNCFSSLSKPSRRDYCTTWPKSTGPVPTRGLCRQDFVRDEARRHPGQVADPSTSWSST